MNIFQIHSVVESQGSFKQGGGAGAAIGGIAGGILSGSSSSKAAKEQAAASREAIAEERRQYDQTRQDTMPWLNTGTSAINRLGYLLGLGSPVEGGKTRDQLIQQYTPQFTTTTQGTASSPVDMARVAELQGKLNDLATKGQKGTAGYLSISNELKNLSPTSSPISTVDYSGLGSYVDNILSSQVGNADGQFGSLTKPFGMDDYVEDPGYQFRLSEGNKALERTQAARGGLLSGAALKAASEYNGGMASQEYGNAYNRFNNDQTTLYNRLAGISGSGQQAANTLGTLGANTSSSIADLLTGIGNSKAAATVQNGNNWATGLASLGSLWK